MSDDTQPDGLAAFLAGAGYHVLQAPKSIPEDAPESLIAAGCYYAPKLLAAIEAVLKHHQPGQQSIPICACGLSYPCYEVRDIRRALQGEGGQ